jgi:hypothetical protein
MISLFVRICGHASSSQALDVTLPSSIRLGLISVVFHNLMKWYAVLTFIIGTMVAAAQCGAVLPALPIAAHLLARDLSHGTI